MVMVPAVFAVIAKMPKGAAFINSFVILERVVERPLSRSTKGLYLSSPISENPNSKQKRTMAGIPVMIKIIIEGTMAIWISLMKISPIGARI